MASITIYHNPRCSKSRATLALLQEHDIEPEIVRYLETPPDAATLRTLLERLGVGVRDIIRKNEAEYKALDVGRESLGDDELIAAIVEHPKLLQRPIVVSGDHAV